MNKKFLTLLGACSFLLSTAQAEEVTVDITEWAFLPNYPSATATDINTNSPTIIKGSGDMAWGGRFQPMDLSEVDSSVIIRFTMTVDGGISGGGFRLGLFNHNGQLQDPSGEPPRFGGVHTGFTGYLWALSGGGHAPGSNDGGAGTGTITGTVAADEGNWVSTFRGYSVTPEELHGPGDGASEEGGTYNVEIELYRLDAEILELNLHVSEVGGEGWSWSDAFRGDDGAVALELMSVNLIAFADLNAGPDNWELSDVRVIGVLAEGNGGGNGGGEDLYLGEYPVSAGWADTGDWLGHLWVEPAPWTYSPSIGWIYVAEATNSESGAWVFAPKF